MSSELTSLLGVGLSPSYSGPPVQTMTLQENERSLRDLQKEKNSLIRKACFRKVGCKVTSFCLSTFCCPCYVYACWRESIDNRGVVSQVEIRYEDENGIEQTKWVDASSVNSFICSSEVPPSQNYDDLCKRVAVPFWGWCPLWDRSKLKIHYLFPEEREKYQRIVEKITKLEKLQKEKVDYLARFPKQIRGIIFEYLEEEKSQENRVTSLTGQENISSTLQAPYGEEDGYSYEDLTGWD